jgi:hypothetical protein
LCDPLDADLWRHQKPPLGELRQSGRPTTGREPVRATRLPTNSFQKWMPGEDTGNRPGRTEAPETGY